MRRPLAVFATLLVLWALAAFATDALARWHLAVFAGGLFVLYPALSMPFSEGIVATLLAGAVCDAAAPVPFGTHVVLFAVAHTLLSASRDRLPHDHAAGRLWIALGANAVLFAALTVPRAPVGGAWGTLVLNFLLSEAFVALAAGWFGAFQDRVLALVPRAPDLTL
jgi:hypothetical protein